MILLIPLNGAVAMKMRTFQVCALTGASSCLEYLARGLGVVFTEAGGSQVRGKKKKKKNLRELFPLHCAKHRWPVSPFVNIY
jgi:hypothetical protein